MKTNDGSAASSGRRAEIEALIASYPGLSPEQLREVLDWFKREASALDVGMIASDPALEKPYRKLRTEHIDRFTGTDILIALAVLVAGAILLWAILYLRS